MQIKSLHTQLYTISSYALRHNSETLPVCNRIGPLVQKWQRLKESGISDTHCQETLGIPLATRCPKRLRSPLWTEAQLQQLLTLRRSYPTYGKAKLAVILKRDHGWTLSESTVGRMLSHLKAKGLITRSVSALRKKRKRSFAKGHAQPWNFNPIKIW